MRGGERETTSGDAFGSAGTHHHGWNGLEGEESDSTQEDVVRSNGICITVEPTGVRRRE